MKVIVSDNVSFAQRCAASYKLRFDEYIAVTPFNYHYILTGRVIHPADVIWHESAANFSPDMMSLIKSYLDHRKV